MFDEVVQAIWGVTNVSSLEIPQSGPDEVYYFQELIQNIVSLEQMGSRLSRKHTSLGVHLQSIRRRAQERKRVALQARNRLKAAEETTGFQNIGSVLGRLTKDTDSADEEEIELGDFIHLDALQEEPDETYDGTQTHSEAPEFRPSAPWKDIHPVVVFLLASVAFSVVLALISSKPFQCLCDVFHDSILMSYAAIQDCLEDHIIGAIHQLPSGYSRSCAIVENFLSIKTEPWRSNMGADIRPASTTRGGALIAMMKASARRASRSKSRSQSFAASSSYKSILRASMSSPRYALRCPTIYVLPPDLHISQRFILLIDRSLFNRCRDDAVDGPLPLSICQVPQGVLERQ